MKKIRIIIATAILASTVSLFFNDCASAQTPDKPTFLVSVLVTDRDGITPVSGAEVMFKSGDVLVSIGITGADGYFYSRLPEGTYDIFAFYPDNSGKMKSTTLLKFELNKDSEALILPLLVLASIASLTPPACRDEFHTTMASGQVGLPSCFSTSISNRRAGPPACRMNSTLQWPVGRQAFAGRTIIEGF